MTVIPKNPSTVCVCVCVCICVIVCLCVDKSGTFKVRISGVHHCLARQDKFNAVSYEIVPQSGTSSLL